jgi:phosphinothricin acetyltransferase
MTDGHFSIRAAAPRDLWALTEIYNHYVIHTAITFDLEPQTLDQRRAWFEAHHDRGRHRLLVAEDAAGAVIGYASTSRWRPKAAYDTTVESSVYCRPDAVGRGIGRALYTALFDAMASEPVHRIVAGAALPNPASVALHLRCGFRQVGLFTAVGFKFGRYWDVAWFERAASSPATAAPPGI